MNLAFKGDNNTKGDVRLHDQRLSVVGATNDFITTKASDSKLEIGTKQGTFSTTDGKSSSPKQGLATTTDVANAINASGWKVQAKGTTVGLVNPGDKVNFTNADKSIEIEYSAEASGLSTIKFKAVTAEINTEKKHPVEITVDDKGIATPKIDETKQATPTGRFVVPTGDATNKYALATAYDVADKVNQTGWNLYNNGRTPALINPGDYVNFQSGNATKAKVVTQASEGATISYDVNVDNTTIKIDSDGNKLTANTGDVDSVTNIEGNSKKGQVTIHKDPLEPSKTDAGKLATVDTVVKAVNNATWYAKAGNDKDAEVSEDDTKADETANQSAAMKAGETLGLKAGKNLRVKRNGTDFTFALNNTVDLTNKGSLTIGETKVDNGGITITPTTLGEGKTAVKLTGEGLNNGGNKIVNVANGTNPTDAVNKSQLDDSISTESVVKADAEAGDTNIATITVADSKKTGDKGAKYQVGVSEKAVKKAAHDAIDVKGTNFISATSNVDGDVETHTVTATTDAVTMTAEGKANTPTATGLTTNKAVADAINASGWKISEGGTSKGIVNPGNEVSFEGGEGTTVTVSDATNGKRTVTIASTVKPNEKGVIEEVTTTTTGDNAKKKGQVQAKSGDENKVTTVKNVANMINAATWYAKAGNDKDAEVSEDDTKADETANQSAAMKAGETLGLKAGKNLRVKRNGTDFTFALNNTVDLTNKGSLTIGETKVDNGGITITPTTLGEGKTAVKLTGEGLNNGGNTITNVAEGVNDTDAVNLKQLKAFKNEVGGYGWNLSVNNGESSSKITKDTTVDLNNDDGNIKIAKNGSNVTLSLGPDVGLGKAGKDGKDGSLAVRGKDGASVEISGKDGSIGLTGPKGKDGTQALVQRLP